MNKKGSIMDTVIWVILAFIIIMFFGLWVFMHQIITDAFLSIPDSNGINITRPTTQILKPVNDNLISGLHTLAVVLMFGFILSIFLTNYLIKSHPIFIIAHIFMTVVAVILAALISNAYEVQLRNPDIGQTLGSFTGATYVMTWLPTIAAVVGVFGMVFLYIGIMRDREFEGGI